MIEMTALCQQLTMIIIGTLVVRGKTSVYCLQQTHSDVHVWGPQARLYRFIHT